MSQEWDSQVFKPEPGSELFHSPPGIYTQPDCFKTPQSRPLPVYEANSKLESEDSSTASSSPISARRELWPSVLPASAQDIGNELGPAQPTITFGKMRVLSKAVDSRLEELSNSRLVNDLIVETSKRIGTLSGKQQSLVTLETSRHHYAWFITVHSGRLLRIIWNHQLWRDLAKYSGASLERESRETLGWGPEYQLTLKIQNPSSGAVTAVNNLLLSMNSEEVLTSATCCAGSIDIRSSWKSKEVPSPFWPSGSGSQATSTQDVGTQT